MKSTVLTQIPNQDCFNDLFTHQPRPFSWEQSRLAIQGHFSNSQGLGFFLPNFFVQIGRFSQAEELGTNFPPHQLFKLKSNSSDTHVHNAERIPRCINKIHRQLETI